MRYTVVTTFNAAGYENYARRMIQTWLATWPSTVELWAYAENCAVAERATNLRVFDLHQTSPELVRFKTQWANVPKANGDVSADPIRSQRRDAGKGFKWDAVTHSTDLSYQSSCWFLFEAQRMCEGVRYTLESAEPLGTNNITFI